MYNNNASQSIFFFSSFQINFVSVAIDIVEIFFILRHFGVAIILTILQQIIIFRLENHNTKRPYHQKYEHLH